MLQSNAQPLVECTHFSCLFLRYVRFNTSSYNHESHPQASTHWWPPRKQFVATFCMTCKGYCVQQFKIALLINFRAYTSSSFESWWMFVFECLELWEVLVPHTCWALLRAAPNYNQPKRRNMLDGIVVSLNDGEKTPDQGGGQCCAIIMSFQIMHTLLNGLIFTSSTSGIASLAHHLVCTNAPIFQPYHMRPFLLAINKMQRDNRCLESPPSTAITRPAALWWNWDAWFLHWGIKAVKKAVKREN